MTAERLLNTRAYGALELKASYQRGVLWALLVASLLHVGVIYGLRTYGGLSDTQTPIPTLSARKGDGAVTLSPLKVEEKKSDPVRERPASPPKRSEEGAKIVMKEDVPPQPELITPQPVGPFIGAKGDLAGTTPGGSRTGGDSVDGIVTGVPQLPAFNQYVFVTKEPEPLPNQPMPEYPEMARLAEAEGTVRVKLLINEYGDVLEVRVLNPEGTISELLIEAATEAVMRWKFIPAVQYDHHVAVWFVQAFKFSLGNR